MIHLPVVRFTSLVVESVLVFICFATTLHHAVVSQPVILLTFPRFLAWETLLASLFFVVIWMMLFSDLRQQQLRQPSLVATLRVTLPGLAILTVLAASIFELSHARWTLSQICLRFLAWSGFLSICMLAVNALARRLLTDRYHNVLILGTGPMARHAWREIRTRYCKSLRVIGFCDTHCMASASSDVKAKYLGDLADLDALLLRHAVDLIVVSLPARSCYDGIQKAVSTARMGGVELISFSEPFQSDVENGSRLYDFFEPKYSLHTALSRVTKRALDVVASISLLLLLSPLLLLVALAVKLSSPGPVLFVQDRYGYRRRKVRLLKFRTMVPDAEALMGSLEHLNEASGPIFKIRNDPRITPLGRFLRKTSIDELPQLWNVVVGDMSLVGPRPMSLRDVSRFSEAYLLRRFSAKPGITGLWQISGRSNLTFDQWIALDFSYIDRWSLALDMQILLATIPVIVRGSGAM